MQFIESTRDAAWFDGIVSTHQQRIFAYVRGRLAADNKDVAQDLVQETFLTAWQKREAVPDNPAHWLYTTAINHLRNHQRRQNIRRSSTGELIDDMWIQTDPTEEIVSRVDFFVTLTTIGERDRELLYMRYIRELAADQIAGVLHITPAAARKRLSLALQRLRASLGPPRARGAKRSGHAFIGHS